MLSDSIDLKSLFRFMTEGFQERPLTLITIQGAGSGCASTNMLHWLPPGPRMRERRFTHLPVRFSREAWALKTTSRSTMNSSFTSWESGWWKNLGMRIREAKINLTIDNWWKWKKSRMKGMSNWLIQLQKFSTAEGFEECPYRSELKLDWSPNVI